MDYLFQHQYLKKHATSHDFPLPTSALTLGNFMLMAYYMFMFHLWLHCEVLWNPFPVPGAQ